MLLQRKNPGIEVGALVMQGGSWSRECPWGAGMGCLGVWIPTFHTLLLPFSLLGSLEFTSLLKVWRV